MRALLHILVMFMVACTAPTTKEHEGASEKKLTQKIGNVFFSFPSSGYAYDHRDRFVNECLEAIATNSRLINIPNYSDTIHIQFLRSRQEMKEYTGRAASGITLAESKNVFLVINGSVREVKPPVKHELMHLISMRSWGYPHTTSYWMNEGLAAFAENSCNGYKDDEIYRFLSAKGMLLPIDDLTNSFYQQPEMIAYHQSAYIVQFLLGRYGVEKFKKLWIEGYPNFEIIYGIPFNEVQTDIDDEQKYISNVPRIDWDKFKQGCF